MHTFCMLADLNLDIDIEKSSRSWIELSDKAALAWGSERDLEYHVLASLRNSIALAKLDGVLQAKSNHYLWLVGFPDAAVVATCGHQPKGVVEVKVPAKGGGPKGRVEQDTHILDNAQVLGQIYDYMAVVKHYHGVAHVFGVLTTYREWRFVWLPESDVMAAADSLAALESSFLESHPASASAGAGAGADEAETEAEADSVEAEADAVVAPCDQSFLAEEERGVRSKDKRVLHASQIYSASESQGELTKLLVSVIYKMYASPVARDRPLRIHVKGGRDFYWAEPPSLSVDDSAAKFNAIEGMSPSAVFVMLRDLGSGADGHAWRAAVGNTGCVVKFLLDQKVRTSAETETVAANHRRLLEKEAEAWRKAYPGINVHVRELAGNAALVMPYARPLAMWTFSRSDAIINATNRAIVELADRGLCHNDLEWRHVGLLVYGEATEAAVVEAKVIFFDLGRVATDVDPAEAREHMRSSLNQDGAGWSSLLRVLREEDEADQHAAAQEGGEGADPAIAGPLQQKPVSPPLGDDYVALPDCRLMVRLAKRD